MPRFRIGDERIGARVTSTGIRVSSRSRSNGSLVGSLALRTLYSLGAIFGCYLEGRAQQVPTMTTADPPLFHSSHSPDPQVSTIGDLTEGLFVSPNQFVFVDLTSCQVIVVRISDGVAVYAGREGDGPGEFRLPRLVGRFGNSGVIVWDQIHRRLAHVTTDGSVAPGPAVDRSILTHWLVGVVAAFPDGRFVIRDTRRPPISHFGVHRSPGRYRDTVQYKSVGPGGQSPRVVAQMLGDESYYERSGSRSRTQGVMFGHLLLEAPVGQHLAIAQTDRGRVILVDDTGDTVSEIPLPPGERLSGQHVAIERERMRDLEEDRARRWIGSGLSRGTTTPFHFRNLPAGDIARPVDRVLGDLNGRVWLRTVRPGEDREHWSVWEPARPKLAFTVVLRKGETLLDAAAGRVLLHTKDQHDVEYVLVRRIRQGTGG